MIRRAGTILFALLAAALGCVALADVYADGRLTLIDPRLLGGLAILGTGFLLYGVVSMREHAGDLEGRSGRLARLAAELENSISTLEAANQRLHASEARYKGLVDSQGDAILRRTPDGRLTYANEAFYKMLGVRPGDVVGTVYHPENHPDSPLPIFGRLAGREAGRERVSYDQHVKTVAGYRWIAWEDYAIRDIDGRLIEIQSVGRDIDERKRLEAALTEARDKAEQANIAKSHFLATMSHEIRTPMNGVLGMARLILDTPLEPDQKTYAEAIRQSGLSLLALIEEILDFSKIESGALSLERGEVALRPLIEGVAELLSTRAHAKNIDLVTAVSAAVPETIEGDAIRLRQVLTNLVGNAIKFTDEGGVLVSAFVEEGESGPLFRFAVRDTGIGVPAAKREKIFEEFVQADSSHARRFEGSGLGLTICKRLVEAMGGTIGVADGDERGSVFWVALPLQEVAASPVPVAGENSAPLAGKRIAVVSSSVILRTGLEHQLAASGGQIAAAPDLRSLSAQASEYDLIILDAGFGDAAKIPAVTRLDRPAMALLPPGHRIPLAALREKGIDGYLTKPVRQISLETRILAVLSGKSGLEAAAAAPAERERAVAGLDVLIAEDNSVNALLTGELLRRRGHSVHNVQSGDAAVAACAARHYDLVIMDLHMPGLGGIEAARRIRAAEAASGASPVAIYALTADALETGRKACLEAGMNGFLTKPVDLAALESVLIAIDSGAGTEAA